MADDGLNRRRLLTAGALIGAAPLAPAAADTLYNAGVPFQPDATAEPEFPKAGTDYIFLSGPEQAFVIAACARIIPKDDLGPGAVEAGVPLFIDRQLAGDFGKAADLYMQGPWAKGEKTQGYQSRMTPAQMYRAAVPAINTAANHQYRGDFSALKPGQQDDFLKALEKGDVQLSGGVDAKGFFTILMQNVIEGYFADPLYGGNRDMAGWKLIGFPGARYDQRAYVKAYGQPYPLPPVGIMGRADWKQG